MLATLHSVIEVTHDLDWLPVKAGWTLLVDTNTAQTDPILDTAVGVRVVTVRLVAAV